jgi:hypothetical protein
VGLSWEAFSDDESHSEEHGSYQSGGDEEFGEGNDNSYDDDACSMLDDL